MKTIDVMHRRKKKCRYGRKKTGEGVVSLAKNGEQE